MIVMCGRDGTTDSMLMASYNSHIIVVSFVKLLAFITG